MTPVVQTEGLAVDRGGTRVLHGVTFALMAGERLAVLGANGSGKSTLVQALVGLLPPAAGGVRLFGAPVGPDTLARVAYVPQASPAGGGVPTSALELVRAGLVTGRRPWPPRGSKATAMAALDQVGMAGLAGRPVGAMSGGQRQRVLVARALARRSELLIMDEPTAGVDQATQSVLVDVLAESPALTLVVVLHDIHPFDRILTRDIVLKQGRVTEDHAVAQHRCEPLEAHPHPGAVEAVLTGAGTDIGLGIEP